MKSSALCQAAFLGLSMMLAACGDRSAAKLPTSPVERPAATSGGVMVAPSVGGGVTMQGSTVGALPAGFVPMVRAHPHPGADGVIHGDAPLTVRFDQCGSTADAGKTLFYLYDWDFDNVADVVGTGTACEQEHIYQGIGALDADGNATVRTNVCVANADPAAHDPSAFWSCRAYTLSLAGGCGTGQFVGAYEVEGGALWSTNPPTFSCVEACAEQFGGAPANYACSTRRACVDHNAHVSFWGGGCHVDPDSFKRNSFYDCGSTNCSASAFVDDWCFSGETNYCFLK